MSMFKKPNRNIRRRGAEITEDDSDVKEPEINIKLKIKTNEKNGDSAIKTVKQTLLSFGEEFNEADEGEVFQVKKSLHSKKIRRQYDKEKEERRKKGSPKGDFAGEEKTKEKNKIIATEEVIIKIKNPIAGPVVVPEKILSGLSAEMAGYKSSSEDEDEQEIHVPHHKFTQPDHVQMLLKSGRIPDAALIHAARKRRQQAREMGGANYIPLDEEPSSKIETENKSRLIREDDNDGSDEDERISMSGIVSFAADREKRKEGLDTFIATDREDEDVDDDEWENQQIRKAVTGAQLAAVQQESYYQYMMSNAGVAAATTVPPTSPLRTKFSQSCASSAVINSSIPEIENSDIFPPLPTDNAAESAEPDNIVKKLRERLEKLQKVHKRRDVDFQNMNEEIRTLRVDRDNRNAMVLGLAKRFQFYQDLRGYITDLVECLDEKIPLITSLEQRLINMYQKKASELINRRRQDIKDQMEDLTPAKNLPGMKRDEERIRRAAEREGRRIRRLKNRSLSNMTLHVDGMSSDDEITEMTAASYRNQQEIIESDASRVFEDVVEEFVSIDDILKRFSEWRKIDKTAYVEAYANMCLPKILGPIIRMNMLMWNPLIKAEDIYIDKLKWVESVIVYSAEKSDTEDSLRKDPDLQLLPHLIDKIMIPKLEQIVKVQWDPLSVSETRQLTAVVRNILQYPFIAPTSKLLVQLINTAIDKMKESVENDMFIPMLPKQLYDAGKSNVFFQRQFAYCVKLFGNLLKWHGIINEEILTDIANASLLNRYLLMGIRTLQPLEAATKCQLVASYIPEIWLKNRSESELHFTQFFSYIRHLLTEIDISNPHGREAIQNLNDIIKYAR